MSECFYLVDIRNKMVFELGSKESARFVLPYLAYKFQDQPIILFGSDHHDYLVDEYTKLIRTGEYNTGALRSNEADTTVLSDIEMNSSEFDAIVTKIGGKVTSHLEDYIRCKYKQKNV